MYLLVVSCMRVVFMYVLYVKRVHLSAHTHPCARSIEDRAGRRPRSKERERAARRAIDRHWLVELGEHRRCIPLQGVSQRCSGARSPVSVASLPACARPLQVSSNAFGRRWRRSVVWATTRVSQKILLCTYMVMTSEKQTKKASHRRGAYILCSHVLSKGAVVHRGGDSNNQTYIHGICSKLLVAARPFFIQLLKTINSAWK